MSTKGDPLLEPLPDSQRRDVGGCHVEFVRAGDARLKRSVYPAGFRWSRDMRPIVGTDRCEHAHVGFLLRGRVEGEYHDGSTFAFAAPAAIVIEPGHDAWVPGDEPAILFEVDFEGQTAARFGLSS